MLRIPSAFLLINSALASSVFIFIIIGAALVNEPAIVTGSPIPTIVSLSSKPKILFLFAPSAIAFIKSVRLPPICIQNFKSFAVIFDKPVAQPLTLNLNSVKKAVLGIDKLIVTAPCLITLAALTTFLPTFLTVFKILLVFFFLGVPIIISSSTPLNWYKLIFLFFIFLSIFNLYGFSTSKPLITASTKILFLPSLQTT